MRYKIHATIQRSTYREFPGGRVEHAALTAKGSGSTTSQGTKIPHAAWHVRKKKKKIHIQFLIDYDNNKHL